MTQDVQEQHKSDFKKLRNKVTELSKALEIEKNFFRNED